MVTKAMPKLRIEIAAAQIAEDCDEMHSSLNIRSAVLTSPDLIRISSEWLRIEKEKERGYSFYEIGFRFIIDHVFYPLRNRNLLEGEVENLLRASIGRVFYAPPKREYLLKAEASENLASRDGASQNLCDALKTESYNFKNIVIQAADQGLHSSMFSNPLQPFFGYGLKSFAEIAAVQREVFKSADAGFYI